MRHWSPWDEQLLRALRGEFKPHAPALAFELGTEGGVAVLHRRARLGLWVATGQQRFRYLPFDRQEPSTEPCDIMDIIDVHYQLFSELLDSQRDTACSVAARSDRRTQKAGGYSDRCRIALAKSGSSLNGHISARRLDYEPSQRGRLTAAQAVCDLDHAIADSEDLAYRAMCEALAR